MIDDSLWMFNDITKKWFNNYIGSPTPVQNEAWPYIAKGRNVLVSAPTGTGKTLAAFLVFIDKLKALGREGALKQELYLIYISPLKSLAGDIRENLKKPLDGISSLEANGVSLQVSIRTGDTTQKERQDMIKKPPHILITTPESLYLMLTSKSGKKILKTAQAVIIDELHVLIDSKRGAHLMLSLSRLDCLLEAKAVPKLQRIGLSATIKPLELAARYLSFDNTVIAAPEVMKDARIEVVSPLAENRFILKDHIWQEIANTIYQKSINARSVIAFCEGRMYSEKLAYYINQFAGEGFARTHHGSLSKEQRLEVEKDLRTGKLRLLCATSSMELGIDVGEIDLVFQIGCPRSISGTMQRLGRAGHNPGRTSVMQIFPRTASEGLYSGMTAHIALNGGVEYAKPPTMCFDVLAQHLVSMAVDDGYCIDDVYELTKKTYSFYEVTKQDIKDILCMLAGDYEHERDVPVRPRILYDRIHDRVSGDAYSRMLAVSTGGTIPDKGLYAVKNEAGVKLGELDEEFVYEARVGETFLLGSFAWQIISQQKDHVVVGPASVKGARMPYWKGELRGRGIATSIAFGSILRRLSKAYIKGTLLDELRKLGLDEEAAEKAGDFIKHQLEAVGLIPDDKTILIEHYTDDTGSSQMIVHSVFGRQVNSPLALLVCEAAKRKLRTNIGCSDDNEGFILHTYQGEPLPKCLLLELNEETAGMILKALLPATSTFNMTFRYNASRALMMGVKKSGRMPLWIQRLRSTELQNSVINDKRHPLMRETMRECLDDHWDIEGVKYILKSIRTGEIRVHEITVDEPSPMSIPFRWQMEADMMYNYNPTTNNIQNIAEKSLDDIVKTDNSNVQETLNIQGTLNIHDNFTITGKLHSPSSEIKSFIAPKKEQLDKAMERNRLPKDEMQLHSLLMAEGDLVAGELFVSIEWLNKLADEGRAEYIEPGLWIATEHKEEYHNALTLQTEDAVSKIIRRLLRYRGAMSETEIASRYCLKDAYVKIIINRLCENGDIIKNEDIYYHSYIYNRARQETIKHRRNETETKPLQNYAALIMQQAMPLESNLNLKPIVKLEEQLEHAVMQLQGQVHAIDLWERILLPRRVERYTASLLDSLLSKGDIFYRIEEENKLSFCRYEDIDWEVDLSYVSESLEGDEKIIYDILLKRGASFTRGFAELLDGRSPYEALIGLVRKGYVCADSFAPVRHLINYEVIERSSIKRKVNERVRILSERFNLTRPLLEIKPEEKLKRLFKQKYIICRETIEGLTWNDALSVLRIWEYVGKVRRGYYVEGLSGAQFIAEEEPEKSSIYSYLWIIHALKNPGERLIWIPAIDPAQPYGKIFPNFKGREFINIQGTVIAFLAGIPIAAFDKQGKLFRAFVQDVVLLKEALQVFVQDFKSRSIYSWVSRLIVKQYPKEIADLFSVSGFKKEMNDYVLYR